MERKKVLVITYYWPPSGGSGVQRWVYFCKYLKDFGYDPIVLTVDDKSAAYRIKDETLLSQIDTISVFKTKTRDPLKFYSYLISGNKNKVIPSGEVNNSSKGWFNKVATFIRGNFFIPDARKGWNRYAYKKAMELIESEEIQYLITTGPPQSTHLVGRKIKRKLPNIKWIADFRDPWVDIYYNQDLPRMKWAIKKDQSLEKSVLTSADHILSVGSRLSDLLFKKVNVNQERFSHIYNGYDAEVMDAIKIESHDHFEMSFVGTLTRKQSYSAGIEMLKLVVESFQHLDLRFCFAGNIEPEIMEEFENALPSVKFIQKGYISHQKAQRLIKNSQLLFNFLAEMTHSEILISGKQMEYIATGNPILCIGNTKGELAAIMEDIPNGAVFEKTEIPQGAEFIQTIISRWEQKNPFQGDPSDPKITGKSRYETARKLGQLLDTL